MIKVKTKMKNYFFPANVPKVILCIILFGINAEIRIKEKNKHSDEHLQRKFLLQSDKLLFQIVICGWRRIDCNFICSSSTPGIEEADRTAQRAL